MFESMLLIAVGTAILAGAIYDATTLTIPNWVSLILLALCPVIAISAGLSWAEAGIHAGVGVAALAVGIALFAGGFVGGGDAKLFAAVSLYIGAAWFGMYVFAVALAGGLSQLRGRAARFDEALAGLARVQGRCAARLRMQDSRSDRVESLAGRRDD
ncbi:MAG: prepilin peptidase, partial [Micropepsaceae bacterium]